MTVYDGANKSVGSAYWIQLDKESQSGNAHHGPCAAYCGPWAVRQGLPTVGWSMTLAQNVQIFITRLLRRSVLVFSLNLVRPTDHITKMQKMWEYRRILLTSGKEYLD